MLEKKSIGFSIKCIREEKKLSQTELVKKLAMEENISVSRETLSKIENDNRTISALEIKAICNVLDVDLNEVFSTGEEKEDLVTLFRKKDSFSDDTIDEIEKLQDMIKIFISQETIFKGKFEAKKRRPLWEEF